ncbi:hypothetical protein AGDE_13932 [Angomonas deanei]|uniref:Uncharacterized protein n=1 Tax=Angomonas deanei TaxID=59799 RepID=A0A7G2CN82_9TRYP|nr:hypothetical protein AGDE_13932 [Angomonas deanei]CAD2220043.1 hypothetical protein, conserved [Angomonas deanei]|eukprot:EPY21595.1 hypothetical protein AGDE_13932 [Angomonas deanei]
MSTTPPSVTVEVDERTATSSTKDDTVRKRSHNKSFLTALVSNTNANHHPHGTESVPSTCHHNRTFLLALEEEGGRPNTATNLLKNSVYPYTMNLPLADDPQRRRDHPVVPSLFSETKEEKQNFVWRPHHAAFDDSFSSSRTREEALSTSTMNHHTTKQTIPLSIVQPNPEFIHPTRWAEQSCTSSEHLFGEINGPTREETLKLHTIRNQNVYATLPTTKEKEVREWLRLKTSKVPPPAAPPAYYYEVDFSTPASTRDTTSPSSCAIHGNPYKGRPSRRRGEVSLVSSSSCSCATSCTCREESSASSHGDSGTGSGGEDTTPTREVDVAYFNREPFQYHQLLSAPTLLTIDPLREKEKGPQESAPAAVVERVMTHSAGTQTDLPDATAPPEKKEQPMTVPTKFVLLEMLQRSVERKEELLLQFYQQREEGDKAAVVAPVDHTETTVEEDGHPPLIAEVQDGESPVDHHHKEDKSTEVDPVEWAQYLQSEVDTQRPLHDTTAQKETVSVATDCEELIAEIASAEEQSRAESIQRERAEQAERLQAWATQLFSQALVALQAEETHARGVFLTHETERYRQLLDTHRAQQKQLQQVGERWERRYQAQLSHYQFGIHARQLLEAEEGRARGRVERDYYRALLSLQRQSATDKTHVLVTSQARSSAAWESERDALTADKREQQQSLQQSVEREASLRERLRVALLAPTVQLTEGGRGDYRPPAVVVEDIPIHRRFARAHEEARKVLKITRQGGWMV